MSKLNMQPKIQRRHLILVQFAAMWSSSSSRRAGASVILSRCGRSSADWRGRRLADTSQWHIWLITSSSPIKSRHAMTSHLHTTPLATGVSQCCRSAGVKHSELKTLLFSKSLPPQTFFFPTGLIPRTLGVLD